MRSLALALVLCALPATLNADCYSFESLGPDMTHCQDSVDKTWHAMGSSWTNSACYECTCSSCCSAYSTPLSYPKDCVSVFDPKACKYKVHKKNNPSVTCPIFSAVGK